MKNIKGHAAHDIYTPTGRIFWQNEYAARDFEFFATHQNRRLVFLTVFAEPTHCPVEMGERLRLLAERLYQYCSQNGIPTRGYSEPEPRLDGALRPHFHAVLAITRESQERMRKHLKRFYRAAYAIQFDVIYDFNIRIFRYCLKGQHTYRDKHGNYTSIKLSKEHAVALRKYGQPIRICVGKLKKVVKRGFDTSFETVKTVVNGIITFFEKKPVVKVDDEPLPAEQHLNHMPSKQSCPQSVTIKALLSEILARRRANSS